MTWDTGPAWGWVGLDEMALLKIAVTLEEFAADIPNRHRAGGRWSYSLQTKGREANIFVAFGEYHVTRGCQGPQMESDQ